MKTINKDPGNNTQQSRRDFIKKSTLAGAGLAVAGTAPGAALAATTDDGTKAKTQQGYQLTQHVLEYYKSAAS